MPSIAGKIFILGEYAVLGGEGAILAAVPERFELRPAGDQALSFHPESPAGRWLNTLDAKKLKKISTYKFYDPRQGEGGFGASTAQFALIYRELHPQADWRQAWRAYRSVTSDEPLPPSGADLVSQWQGGVTHFEPKTEKVQDLSTKIDWGRLMVFSATHQSARKVATHEHLKQIENLQLHNPASLMKRKLKLIIDRGLRAISETQFETLGEALTEYALTLKHFGLEIPETQADREAFAEIPGVLGAKGMGAMQSDGILVWTDGQIETREKVLSLAKTRNLKLVCDGLPKNEKGIQ